MGYHSFGPRRRAESTLANKHNELIAKEGWIFFFPPLIAAILSLLFGLHWAVTAALAAPAAFVAWFFRNPYRQIPDDPDAIVSPADGKVVGIHTLDDGRSLITIFLNIFNVHVNRSPIAGEISDVTYTKGKFLAAYKEEASEINERNRVVIDDAGFVVEVTQIAGLIARRIVCWVKPATRLEKGERFGLIRFGSRMDVVLPAGCEIAVREGMNLRGGSDIIAKRGPAG